MAWFKTDDKFHDHRKTRRAIRSGKKRRDAAAIGLWLLAGTWSADHLRDGFVPADELDRWDDDGEALAERLVAAGFWEHGTDDDGEAGYRFLKWPEYQPTKAELEVKRDQARERMRRHREARRDPPDGDADVRANSERSSQPVQVSRTRTRTRTPAAAAAGGDERGSGGGEGALELPGPVAVLRSRMAAHTALAGLRWETLDDGQLARIEVLIERHGDAVLVEWATRTCRTPPPVFASAFIGTWEAIGVPRAVGVDLGAVRCDICNQTERSCQRAQQGIEADDRHQFTTTRSA